jgi:hypothetical protein
MVYISAVAHQIVRAVELTWTHNTIERGTCVYRGTMSFEIFAQGEAFLAHVARFSVLSGAAL